MQVRIRTALAVGAVSAALALAGCAGNTSDEETTAASEETAAAQTEESTGAEETAEGSEESAASDESTEESESPEDAEAVVPEGYQEVEAPTAGISLAVPEGWGDLKAYSEEQIQAMAEDQGSDLATFQQQIDALDLFYRATEPDENGFSENVNVDPTVLPLDGTPTEEDVTSLLSQQGAELTQYGTVDTPNGEAATGTYTIPDNPAQGEVLIAPTSEGGYAVITVTTSSAERTEELVQDIAGSIR